MGANAAGGMLGDRRRGFGAEGGLVSSWQKRELRLWEQVPPSEGWQRCEEPRRGACEVLRCCQQAGAPRALEASNHQVLMWEMGRVSPWKELH